MDPREGIAAKRNNGNMSGLLPLFPLQLVVFPRIQVPLHIFEDRYKELVGEALAQRSEFGIVLAKDAGIVNAGCTVGIEKVLTRYPDGRLDILTRGSRRFEILSIDQDKSYLRGEVEFFNDDDEEPVNPVLKEEALSEYRTLIESGESQGYSDPDLDDPQVSFQIAQAVQDMDFQSRLLRDRSESSRLRHLADFLKRYAPRIKQTARMKELAPRNGFGSHPASLLMTAMLLNGRVGETNVHGPRPLPIGISVLAHACVLSLIAGPRPVQLPRSKSLYDLTIRNNEHKLVWYHFKKDKLPDVKPMVSKADNRPMRATLLTPRMQIVSAPKNAPKAPQMIWQKAPEIDTDIKFDSANLVAISLPKVDPPKTFVPPAPQPRKLYTPQIDVPAPPELNAEATKIPAIARSVEFARAVRDFQPPSPQHRRTIALPKVDVAAAPDLKVGGTPKPRMRSPAFSNCLKSRACARFRLPPAKPKLDRRRSLTSIPRQI